MGKYFKTEEKLKAYLRKTPIEPPWYVVVGRTGLILITKAQAKELRPDMFPKKKYPRYTKRKPDEPLKIKRKK